MKIVPIMLLQEINICSTSMFNIRVQDLTSKRIFWMSISRSSRLFSKCWNISMGYESSEVLLVEYDEKENNKMTEVKNINDMLKFAQYLI